MTSSNRLRDIPHIRFELPHEMRPGGTKRPSLLLSPQKWRLMYKGRGIQEWTASIGTSSCTGDLPGVRTRL